MESRPAHKAQAAVEYLVILAVVIIVALFVVGVLGGFPSVTTGFDEKQSAIFWAGADVGITNAYVSATASSSKIVVRNNKNSDMQLTSLNLTDNSGVNAYTYATATTLVPGQSSTQLSLTDGASSNKCTTKGNKFSFSVNATYLDSFGNVFTFTGARPLVGNCQ